MEDDNADSFAANALLPKQELLEAHRSKISLHHAMADYDYPTIRLPHSFSKLAGLPTHIYQTVHDGGLAFLVVVSTGCYTAKKVQLCQKVLRKTPKSAVFTRRNGLLPVFLRLRVHDVHRRVSQGR